MHKPVSQRPLLASTVAFGALLVAASVPLSPAVAQDSSGAAADLVRQGDFWRARGRNDLAEQAYNRALQLQPGNTAARRAMSQGSAAPVQAAPAPAPSQPRAVATATQPPRSNAQTTRSSAADRAGRIRVAGFSALQAGELRTAATQFEQALSVNNRDAEALGGLGIVRLRQNRFADARDLLERASQAGRASQWAEALASARFFAGLEDADRLTDAGDTAGAQRVLEELLASTTDLSNRSLAAVQLGDLMMGQGRYADALRAYMQGDTAEPQVAYKVATAEAADAASSGDPMQAEAAYTRALQNGGAADPWLRYAFAGFLLEQGRRSDAAAIIQPLETSTNPEALYASALYYSQADRAADATRILARVPESARTAEIRALDSEIRFVDAERQAKALASAGRTSEAYELLARYDVPGTSPGQQLRLAGTYQQLGMTERAAMLARNVAQQPMLPMNQQEPLVRLLAQTGQDDLALQVIQKASGGDVTTPAASRLYASLTVASADRLREEGMHAEAFEVLQSGWSIAPQDTAILVSLGRLYLAGGMTEEGTQVFEMALQRKPNDREALIGLADAYSARDQHAKARDAYRRLLRQDPDNVDSYLAAARVEQAAGDRRAARRLLEQAQALGAPRGLAQGTAFTVTNPFRTGTQRLSPVAANPFAPETLRASANSTSTLTFRSPVQQALAELNENDAPRLQADVEARVRSGESGLSNLSALTATIKASTPVGRGRIGLSVAPTVVDAGSLDRSASARFGRNATAEALAIVAQQPTILPPSDTQYAAGVALGAYYESEMVQVDVGTTPLGFDKTNIQGSFTWRPRVGQYGGIKMFADRRPVTDSVLSYAGAKDPSSGREWGSVMRTGGGLGLSWERQGTGMYGDIAYRVYAGRRVQDNNAIEMNLGGYRRFYEGDELTASAGIALNYQSFDKNLSQFTYGHGGYFSPQSFVSLAFPVDVRWSNEDWSVAAQISPGYQTYQQNAAALFPGDATRQGQLDALKLLNPDVRSYYDSESRSGFAFTGGLEAWRRMGQTSIGGDARMNTFGNYDEYRLTLRIKQALGGSY